MKPFDLDKCRVGEPICTRDGLDAEFLFYEPRAENEKLFILIDGFVCDFFDNGSYHVNGEHKYDLFMKPKKTTWWFASWKSDHTPENKREATRLYASKEELTGFMTTYAPHIISKVEIEE